MLRMLHATLISSCVLTVIAIPQVTVSDPVQDCINRGGQSCDPKGGPSLLNCPKELSRNNTAYHCPSNGCCELKTLPTNAPNYTPPPTSAFCDKACMKAQLCPNGSKCPATLCCEFRPVTKAPFEASSKVTLRVLTDHWNSGNFIKALARDPTMKDLGGSDRLDSRLSFYRTLTVPSM